MGYFESAAEKGLAGRLTFKERDTSRASWKSSEAFIRADDKTVISAKLSSEVKDRSSLSILISKISDILGR